MALDPLSPGSVPLFRIDLLERHVEQQGSEIVDLRRMIMEERTERAAQDRNRLIAGIMMLGSVITGLVGIIWAYRGVIFAGKQ